MVDSAINGWEAIVGLAALIYAYVHGKGKSEANAKNRDKNITSTERALKARVEHLEEEATEIRKTVNAIEQALDRSYATMTYVHDKFPSREVFDIKMDSVQEHITGKIEAVLQIIKIQREAK